MHVHGLRECENTCHQYEQQRHATAEIIVNGLATRFHQVVKSILKGRGFSRALYFSTENLLSGPFSAALNFAEILRNIIEDVVIRFVRRTSISEELGQAKRIWRGARENLIIANVCGQ